MQVKQGFSMKIQETATQQQQRLLTQEVNSTFQRIWFAKSDGSSADGETARHRKGKVQQFGWTATRGKKKRKAAKQI